MTKENKDQTAAEVLAEMGPKFPRFEKIDDQYRVYMDAFDLVGMSAPDLLAQRDELRKILAEAVHVESTWQEMTGHELPPWYDQARAVLSRCAAPEAPKEGSEVQAQEQHKSKHFIGQRIRESVKREAAEQAQKEQEQAKVKGR